MPIGAWFFWVAIHPASAATLADAWAAVDAAPELGATEAGAERSRAAVGSARAAVLPKVALAGRYTAADEPIAFDLGGVLPPDVLALIGGAPAPIVVQQQDWFEAQGTLLVPLVDADGWATLRAAARAADAAEVEVEVARLQLRLATARVFFGVRAARDAVPLAEQALAVARTQLDVATRRVEAGDAPPRVRWEAEQAVLAAERDALAAEEQRARAEATLTRLTGWPADTSLEAGAEVPPSAPRPEPTAAALRVEAADRAVEASRWAWAPDVAARLTTQWTQNQGFAPDPWFLYAGADVTWTFDGGYRSSRTRDAGAQLAAARAGEELARRRVAEDRTAAEAAERRAVAAASAAEREREVAEARRKEAELAFAEGVIPFSDWERAALAHHAAELAASREREAAALAGVERALLAP